MKRWSRNQNASLLSFAVCGWRSPSLNPMNAKQFFQPRPKKQPTGGDASDPRTGDKRPRDLTQDELESEASGSGNLNTPRIEDTDQATYGASSFGGWGEYMRRKRAKLQIQNAEIAKESSSNAPPIFNKLQIHVASPHCYLLPFLIATALRSMAILYPLFKF